MIIKVTKKAFASNLKFNAATFEAAGECGDAALVYSELATRMRPISKKEAAFATGKVYETFAAALGTPVNVNFVSYDKRQKYYPANLTATGPTDAHLSDPANAFVT